MFVLRTVVAAWVLLAVASGFGCAKRRSPPPAGASAPPATGDAAPTARPAKGALPHELGPLPIPQDNPQSDAKVALGRRLFFEPRLSRDGKFSCYTCHRNEDGNGGHEPIAVGPGDVSLGRHSPSLWNVAYLPALYWDGRSRSLEAQAQAAWEGPNLGVDPDHLGTKAAAIGALPEYAAGFAASFPGEGATVQTVVKALAAFERSLRCQDTGYDRFARGEEGALSQAAQRGLATFMGKGICTACHTPPHFTSAALVQDGTYFNVGIERERTDPAMADAGRKVVSGRDEDLGAFKPPTLRNVARSAPYFHDGSIAGLADAVRYMASGGRSHPVESAPLGRPSPLFTDRELTDGEVVDLVAFLQALNCGTIDPPLGHEEGNQP